MKILAIVMILSMALMLIPTISFTVRASNYIPNATQITYTTIGGPDTSWGTDPQASYDTSSATMQQQVFDPLLMYNGTSMTSFIPMLADNWPGYTNTSNGRWPEPTPPIPGVSPAGTYCTYKFHLRPNVKWQDNESGTDVYVNTTDVVYTIQRGMLQDGVNGVMWLFYTPLCGSSTSDSLDRMFGNSTVDANTYDRLLLPWVEGAVQCNATWVWFNLPYSYADFPQILTQAWGFVMCKQWDIKQGTMWMGSYVNTSTNGAYDTLANPHWTGDNGILHFVGDDDFGNYSSHASALGTGAITSSPLMAPSLISSSEPMMGSGPYKEIAFNPDPNVGFYIDESWSGYWQGQAPTARVVVKVVEEWSNRKAQFLSTNPALQCDLCDVPLTNAAELMVGGNVHGSALPGLALIKHIVQAADYMFFSYNVSGPGYAPTWGNGTEVPNLFSDRDLRLAFMYAFNATEFLQDAFFGYGYTPTTFMCNGTKYYNSSGIFERNIDLSLAQHYLDLAWGGRVESVGINVILTYNTGNVERQIIATELATTLSTRLHWGVGAHFSFTPEGIPWGTYLVAGVFNELPIFVIGWVADYPAASDWASPFLTPSGTYGTWQGMNYYYPDGHWGYGENATDLRADWPGNATVHAMFGPGMGTGINYSSSMPGVHVDDINSSYMISLVAYAGHQPNANAAYQELQDIFYAEASDQPMVQATALHFQRDWIQGYTGGFSENPIAVGFYFFQLSKSYSGGITSYAVTINAHDTLLNVTSVPGVIINNLTWSSFFGNFTGSGEMINELNTAIAYVNYSINASYTVGVPTTVYVTVGICRNATYAPGLGYYFFYTKTYVLTLGESLTDVTGGPITVQWFENGTYDQVGAWTNPFGVNGPQDWLQSFPIYGAGIWSVTMTCEPVGTTTLNTEVYNGNLTLSKISSPYEVKSVNTNRTNGYLFGDIGSASATPPFYSFGTFDGKVTSADTTMYILCLRGTAPAQYEFLGDLGGSSPNPPFYSWYAYDGKVNSADTTMYILCLRGHGPSSLYHSK